MTVYLFSKSYEIGQIINEHLISNNYLSFLFPKTDDITKAIKNLKRPPDLLVLDYTIFNHDFFNIYSYLNEIKVQLPVIFFNDPCITASTRTKHWLYQLVILTYKTNGKQFTDEEIKEYECLFSKIEEIITLEELTPYVELMQKAKPIPESLKRQPIKEYLTIKTSNQILEFKKRAKLPESLFFLLKILEQNMDIPLTTDDILDFYKEEGKQMTENSLKVLISRLRKEIYNDRKCKFIISSNKGAYSFIGFSKS